MKKRVLMSIGFLLSSCTLNHGFPQEVRGKIKPINTEVVKGEYDAR